MPYRKINIWKTLDWWTIALYLILVLAGWFNIYASTYDYDHVGMFDLSGRSGMQMIWIGTSLFLALIILMTDNDWFDIFAYWIYAIIIILLIATIFLAPDIKGSRSWLRFGSWFQIQPAEFAKFATALALAKLLNGYKFQLLKFSNFLKALMLMFLPMILILLQKETGSALVYLAFFFVLYREGMSGMVLLIGLSMILFFVVSVKFSDVVWLGATDLGIFLVLLMIVIIIVGLMYRYKSDQLPMNYISLAVIASIAMAIIAAHFYTFNLSTIILILLALIGIFLLWSAFKFWSATYFSIITVGVLAIAFLYSSDYVFDKVLEPHQQTRIQVVLGMKDDPNGAGYNVNQSKIAIGSGGFWGKGFLNGTQTKLKYVPEQDTDFIFCTVGEERGFVGSVIVLLLFALLILRLFHLAERQRSTFNRVYGYSVASILFFHLTINIGMVIGLTPVIGIPLPFFSYGGSSLWGFTILLFIFCRLDASRSDRL